MSQQGLRQATVRAATGTALTYEGDWHALFDKAGLPAGNYQVRLLAWINQQLSASYTEINGAMQAFASANGAYNWASMGAFALGDAYDAAAMDYFAAMVVQPSGARKALINTLITGLKADGVWPLLDWFCLMAAHDEQAGRLNAKQPAKALTAINSPVFTTDRGFLGDGATSYLNFGEKPQDAGNSYSLNNAHLGAYCNASNSTGLKYQLGLVTVGVVRLPARGNNIAAGNLRLNSVNGATSYVTTSRSGHRIAARSDNATISHYLNGALTDALPIASSGSPATNLRVLCDSTTFADDRLAAVHTGQGLNGVQAGALAVRLHTYFTAIGANY